MPDVREGAGVIVYSIFNGDDTSYFATLGEARVALKKWYKGEGEIEKLTLVDLPPRQLAVQLLTGESFVAKREKCVADTQRGQTGPPSEKQNEVWELIRQGLTNQEIAERLGITHRTVKQHTDTLRAKLGVKHKRQLISLDREEA